MPYSRRKKIAVHLWWIGAFLFAVAAPIGAASLPLEELVENVQAQYERTKDLQAGFVQEATIKSVNQTLTEEGTVYFKKPKRMLWDYSTPSYKKLVISPRKAWLYIPEDNLVYVQDAEKILTSKMTVRFIAGIGKLKDDFLISFAEPQATDGDGNYRLKLIPKHPEMGVEKLFMKINKDSLMIMHFNFTDIYGNVTSLTFSDMQTNVSLSDSIFNFTPPPGVEIYNVP